MDLANISWEAVFWLASALLFCYVVALNVASYRRLRHIPGPFLGAVSYLWLVRNIVAGWTAPAYAQLHARYGPLVRVGPNEVLTDDPDALRQVNGARGAYARAPWYQGLKFDRFDQMASTVDTPTHDALKARLLGGYSGKDGGIDLEAGVDAQVAHLVAVLRHRVGAGPVDLAKPLRDLTLDVITRLAFGEAFGFLDAEGDLYGFQASVDQTMAAMTLTTEVPLLRALMRSRALTPLFLWSLARTGVGRVLARAHALVAKRFAAGEPGSGDMTAAFMRQGLSQRETEAEGILQLSAGSDTTIVALRSTLLYVLSTPRVYTRLRAEIQDAVAAGAAPVVTLAQTRRLPYLQAVVLEGLRMRPPVVSGHYKTVPPAGDTLLGRTLPAGVSVGANWLGLQRRADIYGADVDIFRPERFLEADATRRQEMERNVELGFGLGRWMCAGKNIAFMQINKVCFEVSGTPTHRTRSLPFSTGWGDGLQDLPAKQLMRAFDFQIVYPGKAWDETS